MIVKDIIRAIDLNDYMEERNIQRVRVLRTFQKGNELYYELVYNQRKDTSYNVYSVSR